jgi:hypothetical protein
MEASRRRAMAAAAIKSRMGGSNRAAANPTAHFR